MKYKISEDTLKLREYGRNVQEMVEFAQTLEDDETRNAYVKEIIRIMANLYPEEKDQPDFYQKLWDHLYLIADFEIDIDSPYPKPSPDELLWKKPEQVHYFQGELKLRQYGKNLQLMVKKASEMEEGEVRSAYINLIANIMMQFQQGVDKDAHYEDIIAEQINKLSLGKLNVKYSELTITRQPLPPQAKRSYQQKKKSRSKSRKRK